MFLRKWASWSVTFQQKIKHLDKLIPKLATSTSNGNHQLRTRMPQASCVLKRLILIHIFTTYFLQAWFNQASWIIFYFILLSMAQAHMKVWFGGYELVPFGPFAWAQHMRATKWVKDTNSTSGSWRRSCTRNFHPKTAFILWLTMAQSFRLNAFFL